MGVKFVVKKRYVTLEWPLSHYRYYIQHVRTNRRTFTIHYTGPKRINHFIADKLHPYYKKESYTIQIHHNVEFEFGFLLENSSLQCFHRGDVNNM